ncbi:MAG TPA: sulfite exporter TauE/SafE family protein [Candidatus Saccharimonadales bacterium]|nr:sulfite exporter TauE/SafE family protein [Candidatus Saccharimonadales bacterium]
MKKLVVPVSGLHCKACEILTEDSLKEIKGVLNVEVNHKTGNAEIEYSGEEPKIADIKKALEETGYGLGKIKNHHQENGDQNINCDLTETKPSKRNFSFYITVLASVLIIYLLLNRTSSLPFGGLLQQDFSWPLAIIVGLVAGVSTCLALVGGLVLSLAANYAQNHPEATRREKFRPHILFNLGRLGGFFLLGGILGLIGSAFKLSPIVNSVITIIIGAVVLILGFKLLEIFPAFTKFDFSLPKKFGKIIKISDPIILGALTFFLPCGFTQAMQIYALGTGNFIQGGLIMALFALGTAPGFLGIGGLSTLGGKKKSSAFFVAAGIIVIAFGLFNLTNGYRLFKISSGINLTSLISPADQETKATNTKIEEENGVRIIRMTETNHGYSPNSFTVLKDQPVKLIIDAQAPYSCASSLIIPALKIQTQLKPGENNFKFTPDKTGEIPFSCSMGMYTGKIIVVDDKSQLR